MLLSYRRGKGVTRFRSPFLTTSIPQGILGIKNLPFLRGLEFSDKCRLNFTKARFVHGALPTNQKDFSHLEFISPPLPILSANAYDALNLCIKYKKMPRISPRHFPNKRNLIKNIIAPKIVGVIALIYCFHADRQRLALLQLYLDVAYLHPDFFELCQHRWLP